MLTKGISRNGGYDRIQAWLDKGKVNPELGTGFLASSSAIGRAPAPVAVGVFLVVLGIYALLKRQSLSAAVSRLRHRGDGGGPSAPAFLIAPAIMVVVGVILLIVSKLLRVY